MRTLIAALALVGAIQLQEPELDTQLIEFDEEPLDMEVAELEDDGDETDNDLLAELENEELDDDELPETLDEEQEDEELTPESLTELDEERRKRKKKSKGLKSYLRIAYRVYKRRGWGAAIRKLKKLYRIG